MTAVACAFAATTDLNAKDAAFWFGSGSAKLPLIGAELPLGRFSIAVPAALLCLHPRCGDA
jgi:hypothetical protein